MITLPPHRFPTPVPTLPAAAALLLFACLPVEAQEPVTLRGRVEDAATLAPIDGARVLSADSSISVLTDPAGAFTIRLPAGAELALHVQRIGYLGQRFDLPPEAPQRMSVLRLEPAAIVLPGVTASVEPAVEVLEQNLRNRRNAFPSAMRAYDRTWLDRFAPIGSIYDLVRMRVPRSGPCRSDPAYLCIPGRVRSFANPYPTRRLKICIDGRDTIGPIDEMSGIDVESVALIEFFGGAGVRIYTRDWMLQRARIGWTHVMADPPGGITCQ